MLWFCEQAQNPGRERKPHYLHSPSALYLFAQLINTTHAPKSRSEALGILLEGESNHEAVNWINPGKVCSAGNHPIRRMKGRFGWGDYLLHGSLSVLFRNMFTVVPGFEAFTDRCWTVCPLSFRIYFILLVITNAGAYPKVYFEIYLTLFATVCLPRWPSSQSRLIPLTANIPELRTTVRI